MAMWICISARCQSTLLLGIPILLQLKPLSFILNLNAVLIINEKLKVFNDFDNANAYL